MRSYLILFSFFITNLLSAQTIRDATLLRLANGDTTFISQVSALRAQFPDSTSAANADGPGTGVYWQEVANQFVFKRLINGTGITFATTDSSITINSTGGGSITLDGEVNGATSATTVDTVRRVWFNRTYSQPDSLAKLQWSSTDETLKLGIGETDLQTVVQIGQETLYPKVTNQTGSIIRKGTPVMVDSVAVIQGDNIRIRPAIGSTLQNVATVMGIAAHDIAANSTGYVTWFGYVTEVDEANIAQAGITFAAGNILYLSATEAGKLTNVLPAAPNIKDPIAIVVRRPNSNNLTLLVRPQLTPDIHDVNDISISIPTAGQVLRYNSGGFWENGSPLRLTIQEETSTLTQRDTLRFIGSGITATDVSTRTNVSLDNDLNSLANLASTGYVSRVATDSFVTRSFNGGSEESSFASIGVGFGDGISGNTLITVNTNNSTFKRNVVAATTGNITLSGLQSVDGITLTSGNRVLVWQQTDQKTNGIYSAASGAWTRTTDLDSDSEINRGVLVYVEKGIQHDSKYFVMTTPTDPGIVIGTSNINFQQSSIRDVLDGDKGDITVSASGATWNIDAGVVANTELALGSGGIYKGSGTIPSETDALVTDIFSISYDNFFPAIAIQNSSGSVALSDNNFTHKFELTSDSINVSGNRINYNIDTIDISGVNIKIGFPSGGVTDGDKGDITVSVSGTTWSLDAGVVDSTKIATGAISITDINQSNASPNQVLKWNGTQWAPAPDETASGSGATNLTFSENLSPFKLNSDTGTDVTFAQGTGITMSRTNNELTVTAVDQSATNEGSLTVGAGTGTTSLIQSNTSGSTNVTLEAGPNIFLSETGNTIYIEAEDTDLELSGNSPPYFINSSTGSDVSIAQGNGITLSRSTNQLTITAVDQSATNELQDLSLSGQTLSITSGTGVTLPVVGIAAGTGLTASSSSGTHTLALTGQALDLHNLSTNGILARVGTDNIEARSIQSGSGITVTNGDGVSGNISISATDASVTNEGSLSVGAGTSSTSLIQSNTSGSNTVTLEAGSNITLTENTTTNTITIASSGGGGTPAGSNFNVQFNNAGVFGAESVFTYDTTYNRLGVGVSVPVAALNSRTTLTAATALSFLAENNKGDDVIKVKNNGEIQLGNNEAIYPLFKQSTSATDTSFTGNGITFESQPAAGTSDLFSFYHPSSSISQTTNIIRQGGVLTVTSGSSSYRGYIGNPTINVSGGTGDVDIINISPTVTQAAGGINMIDINPSVTAASGGLRGLYTNITSASNFYQIFADGTAVSRFDGNVGILTDPDAAARLHVNGVARVDATILSRGTGDVTGSTTSAALRLQNTTPTTGKTWFIGSKDNGTFELSSTDASNVITTDANSTVKIGFKLAIGDTSNVSPNSILGRNTTSGEVGTIKIGSGLSLASGTLSATGGGTGTVTTSGTPTTDRLAKFTGSTVIGNSLISESGTSIGIDVTTPTAALHLKAGTATANTAPLKFTSGTINTTPEAGAMEYDGTNFYLTNGSGTRNVIGTSGGNFTPQVTEYTTATTNTTLAIPSGATMVEIVCIGSGSGGGSGRRGSTTTARTGGGGGASGNFSITTIRVSDITSTPLLVTVGAGGAGGAAITTNDANGIAGGTGNLSQVTANNGTILCFANGANAGGGGGREATAATAGTTRTGGDLTGAAGVISSVTGGGGSTGTASNIKTPSGGGSAGGLSTSNSATTGGNGGTWNFGQVTQSNQGTTGTPNAGNGATPTQGQIVGGAGGGGGASQAAAAGGNGGNGVRGGGGGGGAASSNGFNSGAGGNGGAGYVRVTFY